MSQVFSNEPVPPSMHSFRTRIDGVAAQEVPKGVGGLM
jgi:hypothetical protein